MFPSPYPNIHRSSGNNWCLYRPSASRGVTAEGVSAFVTCVSRPFSLYTVLTENARPFGDSFAFSCVITLQISSKAAFIHTAMYIGCLLLCLMCTSSKLNQASAVDVLLNSYFHNSYSQNFYLFWNFSYHLMLSLYSKIT